MEVGLAALQISTLPPEVLLTLWETNTLREYEATVKKLKIKLFSKETVEWLHLIFWPGSQRRVHCHTARPEPNRMVTVDRVLLLVLVLVKCNE
jgi:hypothetical protein